jgi:hypothetical protein
MVPGIGRKGDKRNDGVVNLIGYIVITFVNVTTYPQDSNNMMIKTKNNK